MCGNVIVFLLLFTPEDQSNLVDLYRINILIRCTFLWYCDSSKPIVLFAIVLIKLNSEVMVCSLSTVMGTVTNRGVSARPLN